MSAKQKLTVFVLAQVLMLVIVIPGLVVEQKFIINCEGRLKRAADANTVEIAKKELDAAINYLKANGLTSGQTGVLWNTPDNDIDFWFKNLTAARDELNTQALKPAEQAMILKKLRETLLDKTQAGESVTVPPYLAFYPWCFIAVIMQALAVIFAMCLCADLVIVFAPLTINDNNY